HVSDQGRFGFARLDAAEQRLDALGHGVVNAVMGAALWQRLQEHQNIHVQAPARVKSVSAGEGCQLIQCDLGAGREQQVQARLAVAADGAKSTLRQSAGIQASGWDYQQVALVTNVSSQRFHDHIAYERFTPAGPLALLPLSRG